MHDVCIMSWCIMSDQPIAGMCGKNCNISACGCFCLDCSFCSYVKYTRLILDFWSQTMQGEVWGLSAQGVYPWVQLDPCERISFAYAPQENRRDILNALLASLVFRCVRGCITRKCRNLLIGISSFCRQCICVGIRLSVFWYPTLPFLMIVWEIMWSSKFVHDYPATWNSKGQTT